MALGLRAPFLAITKPQRQVMVKEAVYLWGDGDSDRTVQLTGTRMRQFNPSRQLTEMSTRSVQFIIYHRGLVNLRPTRKMALSVYYRS